MPVARPQPWEVSAGELRQRVSLVQLVESSTGSRGQPVYTPTTIASNVPAKVVPTGGTRTELAQQLVPTSTHQVELHYRSDLPAGPSGAIERYVLLGSRKLRIGHVVNVEERNRKLVLACTEEPA